MASGTFNSSTGVNLNLYCEWSSTTNTTDNYSTVTMRTYLKHHSLYVGARSDSYVKCNGENYTHNAPAISYGGSSLTNTTLLSSKSFKVYHNSDGTKSITLEAGWRFSGTYSGQSISWITCSKTVTLDNIPRAATINSAPNFTSNENPRITYSNPGGFTLNARMEFGNTSIQRNNIGNSGSYTFTLTNAERNLLFSKCPNSSTLAVRFVVATKIGSLSETHRSFLDRTMIVQSGNPTFTSVTAEIVNNTVPSSWGIYVQGKSQCKLTINGASGIYGSSISSYLISGGGFSGSNSVLTTGVLNNSGNITFTATIKDSRGRTASKTVTISVYPYVVPTISSVLTQRCLSDGTLNDDGTYIRALGSFAFASCNGNNSVTSKVCYRKSGTEAWSEQNNFTSGSPVIIGGDADGDFSYQVMFEVIDTFSTIRLIDIVSTAFTTMDFKKGGKGIAIGKVAEYDNLFDINMETIFRNGLTLVDVDGVEINILEKLRNL